MKAHYANMRTCWYCCGAQKNWVAWYAFLLVIVLVPAYVYGEIEIGALAAMMEAKNRAVSADYAKSLKFTVSVRPVYHFPRSNMPPMLRDGFETAWRMCTFAFEGEKRYLRMQEGRANGLQNSEWQHEYVEVWTTQEALKYYPSERFGEIYPGDGDEPRGGMRFQRTPSPFDFAGLHDSVDGMYGVSFHLPAMLNSPDARVLPGIITLDDSECIVIATPSGEPLYWLDVNRGYIPKKALVSRLSVDGVSEKRIYNESFQEVSPGLWAVTKARIEWVGPLPGSSQSDDRQLVILADIIYEYSDIVFNEPLADGQFGTPWPDGTVSSRFSAWRSGGALRLG